MATQSSVSIQYTTNAREVADVITKASNDITASINKISQSMKQLANSSKQFEAISKSLKSTMSALGGQAKKNEAEIDKLNSKIKELTQSIKNNEDQTKKSDDANKKSVGGWKNLYNSIGDTASRFNHITAVIGKVYRGIAMVGTAVNDLMKDFVTFEYALTKFSAITGEMQSINGEVSEFAQNVGLYTQFTTTQAMDALNELAQMGFKSKAAMSASLPVLDLATVGNIKLSRSADIVASSMLQFQLKTNEAYRVADAFAFVANNTGANVEQLAQGFKFLGVNAAQTGLTLEGTAVILGSINDLGLKSGLAGRGFRQGLKEIVESGYLKKFKKEGDEVIDTLIRFVENTDKADFQKMFPNIQGATAVKVLKQNIDRMKMLRDEQYKSMEGAAARATKIMTDNTQTAIKLLESAQESVRIRAGMILNPGYLSAIKSITDGFVVFAEKLKESQPAMEWLGSAFARFGEMVRKFIITFSDGGGISTASEVMAGLLDIVTNLLMELLQVMQTIKLVYLGIKMTFEILLEGTVGLVQMVMKLPTYFSLAFNVMNTKIRDMLVDVQVATRIISKAQGEKNKERNKTQGENEQKNAVAFWENSSWSKTVNTFLADLKQGFSEGSSKTAEDIVTTTKQLMGIYATPGTWKPKREEGGYAPVPPEEDTGGADGGFDSMRESASKFLDKVKEVKPALRDMADIIGEEWKKFDAQKFNLVSMFFPVEDYKQRFAVISEGLTALADQQRNVVYSNYSAEAQAIKTNHQLRVDAIKSEYDFAVKNIDKDRDYKVSKAKTPEAKTEAMGYATSQIVEKKREMDAKILEEDDKTKTELEASNKSLWDKSIEVSITANKRIKDLEDARTEQTKKNVEALKEYISKVISDVGTIWSAVTNTASAFGDFQNTLHQNEMNRIKSEGDKRIEVLQEQMNMSVMSSRAKMLAENRIADLQKKNQAEIEAKEKAYNEKKKGWAITEAIVNGALAVTKTFADYGFSPFGFIMAGLSTATTAAQIATISAQKFANGGIIGGMNGASYGQDNTMVSARKGEMIINAPQQRELWETIRGNKRGSSNSQPVSVSMPITINGNVDRGTLAKLKEQQNDFLQQLEGGLRTLSGKGRLSFAGGRL